MKKAYVVGTNVSTSLSPTIFEYWFKKYNIRSASYECVEVLESRFDFYIESLLKQEDLVGLNITIPYKEKITTYAEPETKNAAHTIGAVNYIYKLGTKWIGRNSDCDGFWGAVKPFNKKIKRDTAIVIGFGGAAKAIIFALLAHPLPIYNFKKIKVFNRSFERLKKEYDQGIFQKLQLNQIEKIKKTIEIFSFDELEKHMHTGDLIINTTPINPLSTSGNWKINKDTFGFDAVYRPRTGTGFLEHFGSKKRIEGIKMLVFQAQPCFRQWFMYFDDRTLHPFKPEADEELFDLLYKKLEQ